jgi:hypothetical protein
MDPLILALARALHDFTHCPAPDIDPGEIELAQKLLESLTRVGLEVRPRIPDGEVPWDEEGL